jgi:hypothetical protein
MFVKVWISHKRNLPGGVREGKRSFQELNAPNLEKTNRIKQVGGNVPPTRRGKLGMQMGCFAT